MSSQLPPVDIHHDENDHHHDAPVISAQATRTNARPPPNKIKSVVLVTPVVTTPECFRVAYAKQALSYSSSEMLYDKRDLPTISLKQARGVINIRCDADNPTAGLEDVLGKYSLAHMISELDSTLVRIS